MGRTCVVPGCTKKSLNGNAVSFHRFPLRHPEKLQLWLDAIGLVNQDLAKHHRICSEHFKPTDFYSIHANKKKIMKEEAIPSLNLHCSPRKNKVNQAKYKSTRSRSNFIKPVPSTSREQSETKYSQSLAYNETTTSELVETWVPQQESTSSVPYTVDASLLELQQEKIRQQMQHELLLFEQQMKLLEKEIEAKAEEKEQKIAEHEIRMQLLETQLEKAHLDLEEVKFRMYRFHNSNVTPIKNEVIEESEEHPVTELTILPNDIQLVPMTNGAHSSGSENLHSDSNE